MRGRNPALSGGGFESCVGLEVLAKKVAFITSEVIGANIKNFVTRAKAPHIIRPLAAKQLKKKVDRILAQSA